MMSQDRRALLWVGIALVLFALLAFGGCATVRDCLSDIGC